jgi:hypothetical protein
VVELTSGRNSHTLQETIMARGPLFVRQDVFEQYIRGVPTLRGGEYQDLNTIYGSMSRLAVSWLATTDPAELEAKYNEFGWKGEANARAIHEAARRWFLDHHAQLAKELGISAT